LVFGLRREFLGRQRGAVGDEQQIHVRTLGLGLNLALPQVPGPIEDRLAARLLIQHRGPHQLAHAAGATADQDGSQQHGAGHDETLQHVLLTFGDCQPRRGGELSHPQSTLTTT
jgi:hypothetical protein